MRYSLRLLIVLVTIAAVACVLFAPPDDPLESLSRVDAVVGSCDSQSWYYAPFFEYPNESSSNIDLFFGIGTKEIEHANIVWFSPDKSIDESHIRLLQRLPNLMSVSIPCKFENQWLRHLEKCKSLRSVSLSNSTATDPSVEYIKKIPKIEIVYTEATSISASAKQSFLDSGKNRMVDEYVTDP